MIRKLHKKICKKKKKVKERFSYHLYRILDPKVEKQIYQGQLVFNGV